MTPMSTALTEVKCSAILTLTGYHPGIKVGQAEDGRWYMETVPNGLRYYDVFDAFQALYYYQEELEMRVVNAARFEETMAIVESFRNAEDDE